MSKHSINTVAMETLSEAMITEPGSHFEVHRAAEYSSTLPGIPDIEDYVALWFDGDHETFALMADGETVALALASLADMVYAHLS